jgi:hypothetical protein
LRLVFVSLSQPVYDWEIFWGWNCFEFQEIFGNSAKDFLTAIGLNVLTAFLGS